MLGIVPACAQSSGHFCGLRTGCTFPCALTWSPQARAGVIVRVRVRRQVRARVSRHESYLPARAGLGTSFVEQ